jgi:ABC-type transport system involved in cytochrome c biogenesis permease subunit
MRETESVLLWCSLLLLLAAGMAYLLGRNRWAHRCLAASLAVLTTLLVVRGLEGRHLPFADMEEALLFFTWCIVVALVLSRTRSAARGIACLLGSAFLVLALVFSRPAQPLSGALASPWFLVHVPITFMSYGFFIVACSEAVLCLRKDSVEESVQAQYAAMAGAMTWSFVLLTAGIVTGAFWADSAWGTFWSWDPKETASLALWLVQLAFIHRRTSPAWHGRRSAWLVIAGFAVLLFTFIGLNLISIASLHTYVR